MDKGLQCARCSEMFRAWLFRMCNMFRNASLLRMCQMYNVCLQSKSLLNLLPNTAKVLNSDFWQKASGARGSAPRNAPARRTLLVLHRVCGDRSRPRSLALPRSSSSAAPRRASSTSRSAALPQTTPCPSGSTRAAAVALIVATANRPTVESNTIRLDAGRAHAGRQKTRAGRCRH